MSLLRWITGLDSYSKKINLILRYPCQSTWAMQIERCDVVQSDSLNGKSGNAETQLHIHHPSKTIVEPAGVDPSMKMA